MSVVNVNGEIIAYRTLTRSSGQYFDVSSDSEFLYRLVWLYWNRDHDGVRAHGKADATNAELDTWCGLARWCFGESIRALDVR
jgi:hypothetical protein